jgi:hypothetical protein
VAVAGIDVAPTWLFDRHKMPVAAPGAVPSGRQDGVRPSLARADVASSLAAKGRSYTR